MTAAVLSIGTELTRGELLNTNAAWLSDQLTTLGCDVVEHMTVPDDVEAIRAALATLASRNAHVVCTGGLGPTSDDLTAASVAAELLGDGEDDGLRGGRPLSVGSLDD